MPKKQLELSIPEKANLEDLEELMEQVKATEAALETRLREAKKEKKAAAVAKIVKAMNEAEVDIYDLAEALGVRTEAKTTGRTSGQKKHPAPPKFKNPATGETHSGRGQLPAWLKEARDAGKLEEFRIK